MEGISRHSHGDHLGNLIGRELNKPRVLKNCRHGKADEEIALGGVVTGVVLPLQPNTGT
jgi:hypothetical protein